MAILKTSNNFAWWQAFLAGFAFLASATILADVISDTWAGLMVALSGALNAGTAAYIAQIKQVQQQPYRYSSGGGDETYRVVS